MAELQHPSSSFVRHLLQLTNQVHNLSADPVARKESLLHGLCQLFDAKLGLCTIGQFDPRTTQHTVVSLTCSYDNDGKVPASILHYVQATEPANPIFASLYTRFGRQPSKPLVCLREDIISDAAWYASPHVRHARHPSGLDHCIFSLLPLAGTHLVATISLNRAWNSNGPFLTSQCQLLETIHSEMAWIYRSDLPFASAEISDLSPRQQQTLQYLLAGSSEKQIATKTGLSRNTIHHYVKALYRRFGVSSRSELLVHWVNKK